MKTLTIGSRGSALALWQTHEVRRRLVEAHPGLAVEVKVITTKGDTSQADRLVGQLEKGFFTAELEAELREQQIDLAVHSLKDLPTRLPDDLAIAALLTRAAPFDLLIVQPDVVQDPKSAYRLPLVAGATVGASSLRREHLLATYAPEASSVPLRGNVPTRVTRLREGKVHAILLAAAGVQRLGLDLEGLVVFKLNPEVWLPAPGQGAIAVECRADDGETRAMLATLDDTATRQGVDWERGFLRALEGGCTTPFGCYVKNRDAWLGMATASAWHVMRVKLPATHDPGAVHDILSKLASEDATHARYDFVWLYRKL